MYKALFSVIVSMLFILFISSITSNIFSQEKYKEVELVNNPSEDCSFGELGEMFGHYYKYYFELFYSSRLQRDWTMLSKKYNCKDVFNELFEKEKKRISHSFNKTSNNEGIRKGYVIAYGVYLYPPYEITEDYVNSKLFINGIQIWPLLRPELIEASPFEVLSSEKYEAINQINFSVDNYKNTFKKIVNNVIQWQLEYEGKDKAQLMLDSYLSSSKKDGFIDDYIIFDKDNLKYEIFLCDRWGIGMERRTIEDRRKEYVENEYLKPDNSKPMKIVQDDTTTETKNKTTFIKSISNDINKSLTQDSVLVFSSSYTDFTPYYLYNTSTLSLICKTILTNESEYNKLLLLKNIDSPRSVYKVSKEISINLNKNDCSQILKRLQVNGELAHE